MLRRALSKSAFNKTPRRFAGGGGAHPQKLGDKTHLETAIVASGEFFNSGNMMLGAFCKKHPKEPVALLSDKSRAIFHEFSKDLHAHDAFKNESATGKGIFTPPKKGFFYKIESDVVRYEPENNKLVLQDKVFTYDNLILASELQFDWGGVKNLEEALKDYWNSHVVSTAQVPFTANVNRANREFRYDNFIMAIPPVPHKNEGTSHIFYWFKQLKQDRLIASQWYDSQFIITTPQEYLHRVPSVHTQLENLAKSLGIHVKYNMELVEVKYNKINHHHRVAETVYKNTKTGQVETLSYGMLAAYPNCSVPKNLSPFTDSQGLIDVDQYTLQHKKYPNVFSFGECTNLPTINNAVAAIPQAHVVAANVYYQKKNMPLKGVYDGTSATPIFTDRGKMIMPGFKYNWNKVNTMLTSDTESPLAGIKQSLSFMLFKRYEKKFFEKKMQGKIYGPPKWKSPSKTEDVRPQQTVAHPEKS